MIIKMLEVGPLMVNCYIVGDEETGEAAVFDPGGHGDRILEVLKENGLKIKYIVNTHSHFDHVGANQALQDASGAPIVIHREEAPALGSARRQAAMFDSESADSAASQFVRAGDVLEVGSIRFRVIDVRGHSAAGIGFVFEGDLELEGKPRTAGLVICGDALFAGSIGATDHPQGNLALLLDNIRSGIFTLPEETLVLPGHGPVTTVGNEKRNNPFFRE